MPPELTDTLRAQLDALPPSVVFQYLIDRFRIRTGQLRITARSGRYDRSAAVLPLGAADPERR